MGLRFFLSFEEFILFAFLFDVCATLCTSSWSSSINFVSEEEFIRCVRDNIGVDVVVVAPHEKVLVLCEPIQVAIGELLCFLCIFASFFFFVMGKGAAGAKFALSYMLKDVPNW